MSGAEGIRPKQAGQEFITEFHSILDELSPELRADKPARSAHEANLQVQAVLGAAILAHQRLEARQAEVVVLLPIQPESPEYDQAVGI